MFLHTQGEIFKKLTKKYSNIGRGGGGGWGVKLQKPSMLVVN